MDTRLLAASLTLALPPQPFRLKAAACLPLRSIGTVTKFGPRVIWPVA
jgi:hypothetical protein